MTREPVGAAANQALTIATTAAAAAGAKAIPLTVFFGALNGLLVLFTSDYEQPAQLTLADLDAAVDKIKDHITDRGQRDAALTATGPIRAAFSWYREYNARVMGGEQFSEEDLKEIRRSILDALGPNSNLAAAVATLARPEIGKFAAAEFALGASLLVKMRFLDIALQANRGDAIAPAQFIFASGEASANAQTLGKLVSAAEAYGLAHMGQWSQQHRNAPSAQFAAERDRVVADLYGGPDGYDDLRKTRLQLATSANELARLAAELNAEIARRMMQGQALAS